LVVLADSFEHVDHRPRLADPQPAILGVVARQPPDGRVVEPDRVVVSEEQEQAERVGEVDVAEVPRGVHRQERVPGLERALELGVGVALRRHGERMFAQGSGRATCVIGAASAQGGCR
jgi:hypothetical protein